MACYCSRVVFLTCEKSKIRLTRFYAFAAYQLQQEQPSSSYNHSSSLAHWAHVDSPIELTLKHEAQWYTVKPQSFNRLGLNDKLSENYRKQADTFLECSFMVRKPFLEVVHCMRNVRPYFPINRLVLYGKVGTGKSVTLNQAFHCGHEDGWVLVNVPSVRKWNHNFQEISMSSWKPGRIDLPLESAEWLQDFKKVNQHVIEDIGALKTSKDYEWGKRDSTPAGTSLLEVIENGINRVRFATDAVGVLLKELKSYASQRKVKLLVTIDEANSMFHFTAIKREDKSKAPAQDVSLNRHFSKALRNDWSNGLAVIAVDPVEYVEKIKNPSVLPYYLLGNDGFNLLDPFVPIEVPNYTQKELKSCLDYYFSKNWIQTSGADSDEGRKELAHLSDFNPRLLERICAAW